MGVGHRAIIHGSVIDDDVLIAMGAVLLNGVHVGSGSIIGIVAMLENVAVIVVLYLMVSKPGA